MSKRHVSQYLPGVADVNMNVLVGRGGAQASEGTQRTYTRRTLPVYVPCPSGCRQGGFDLAEDLHDRVVAKNREEAQAVLRCRGYQELGRGQRKACDHVLAYGVRLLYGVSSRFDR